MDKTNDDSEQEYDPTERKKPANKVKGPPKFQKNKIQKFSSQQKAGILIKQNSLKKKKLIQKFWQNYTQKISCPMNFNSVFNFHDLICINENSIRDPQCQDSFFRTLFYFKCVHRTQLREDNCLSLSMRNTFQNPYPLEYILQRFKSLGNQQFYQIAEELGKIHQILSFSEAEGKRMLPDQNPMDLEKLIDQKKGKAYMIRVSSTDSIIVSKEFLQLCDKNLQDLAIEGIKFKAILTDFFTPIYYVQQLKRFIDGMKTYIRFMSGEIDYAKFAESFKTRHIDVIQANNKNITVEIIGEQVTPDISYYEVGKVVSVQDAIPQSSQLFRSRKKSEAEYLQQKILKNSQTLNHLTQIPQNYLPQNQSQVCKFQIIKKDRQ